MKLRVGDTIQVKMGKDKGKTGSVGRVMPKEHKVVVDGVNEFKRHVKSRSQNQKSEIITITKPLPVSNVALVCPKCKKTTRIGFEVKKEEKVRICRKCKAQI